MTRGRKLAARHCGQLLETFLARRREQDRAVPAFVNLMVRRGLDEEPDALAENDPALAALYAAVVRGRIASGPNVGNRVATLGGDPIDGDSLEAMSSPRCAAFEGFNLHESVAINALDRARLERLLRYAARPAIALDRLSRLPDGRLVYRLKRIWSDGSTAVVFEPQDFTAKLAALVPAPESILFASMVSLPLRENGVLW